jgi:DnaJ like chaperone protein
VLEQIRIALGFSSAEFAHIEAVVHSARRFGANGFAGGVGVSAGDSLRDAYAVLGVEASASDARVKKAYRRMMNQHHPDKLVAKGLPEEMIKLATEKTQEIKRAYDLVKKHREHQQAG